MKKLIVAALFFILNTQLAHANCSDLASKFSQSPNSMNSNELGSLKTCVSDKLKQILLGGNTPVPAAMPAEVYHTPAPVPAMRPN